MSDVLEIRVKKSHVAVLSVVVLVASASAAVNVRDPMNVFGDLKITGGEVSAEDQNQNPANITLTSPINMQNNNIYNIGNLNGQTGGSGLTIPPYNDISNQRQTGTTYTNNHNGPKLVTVIMNTAGEIISDRRLRAFVNGKNVQAYGSGDAKASGFYTVSFFVPQGANYRVTGNYANIIWYEQDLQGGSGEGGGNGGSTGIGEVDIIEEDGTLGPYKYCSIAKLEYPDDFRGGCTVSRNSEGVWEKTTDADNNYECHAACFGLQTETATVTVSAEGQSGGNIQTVPLDREYQNIIKAEWTGGGIQPERTPDGPNSRKTNWRISLHNSQTNQRYEIARTGGREVPGGTQAARPPYFAEGDFTGTSLNPVTDTTAVGVSYRQDSYTARFPQVTADGVKLNAGGYNEFIFNDKDPETIYWSGSEEVKITYVPQN